MRGKDAYSVIEAASIRITPAYAGKSIVAVTEVSPNRDHPRLCGEKVFQTSEKSTLAGSPPPMRGKAWEQMNTFLSGRITPAYAGKSLNQFSMKPLKRDHPRLCGEK